MTTYGDTYFDIEATGKCPFTFPKQVVTRLNELQAQGFKKLGVRAQMSTGLRYEVRINRELMTVQGSMPVLAYDDAKWFVGAF